MYVHVKIQMLCANKCIYIYIIVIVIVIIVITIIIIFIIIIIIITIIIIKQMYVYVVYNTNTYVIDLNTCHRELTTRTSSANDGESTKGNRTKKLLKKCKLLEYSWDNGKIWLYIW